MQKIAESAAEQGKEPIKCFFAIPFNHVLSWPLRSQAFAEKCGIRTWHFMVKEKLMFYLVPHPDYERLLASFKKTFLNVVDMRPLDSMAMEFVPMSSTVPTLGQIKLRSYVHYMVPPLAPSGKPMKQETIDNLAVTLAPGVPSPENWINQE